MSVMSWEEKLSAFQALSDTSLRMRKPGDWYVSAHVEVKNRSMLEGRFGNGRSPQEAVENHWDKLTNLAPHEYIIVDAMRESRRAVCWNGFMWKNIEEKNNG